MAAMSLIAETQDVFCTVLLLLYMFNYANISKYFYFTSSYLNMVCPVDITMMKPHKQIPIKKNMSARVSSSHLYLFNSENLRNVELQHVLNAILECDDRTRTACAWALHLQLDNTVSERLSPSKLKISESVEVKNKLD